MRNISKYLAAFFILTSLCGCESDRNQSVSPQLNTTILSTPSGNTITSIEAEGNLEATHVLACMPLQSVTPEYTPSDLNAAVIDCAKKGDYENAAALYVAAGLFATFDTLRVADRTAHQAKTMLVFKLGQALSEEERKQWKLALDKYAAPDASVCQNFRKLGPPTYYPQYMIQHGMKAISGDNADPIVKDFDAGSAWTKSLEIFLHCMP